MSNDPVCRFDDVEFDILSDDQGGEFPYFSIGIDGPPTIQLSILIYSRPDAQRLYRKRTRATIRTALGTFAGVAVRHAGIGTRTLRLPTGANYSIERYSAILTDLVLTRNEFHKHLYFGQATFTVLSNVT